MCSMLHHHPPHTQRGYGLLYKWMMRAEEEQAAAEGLREHHCTPHITVSN